MDNDEVLDGEDPDDDNNGVPDSIQETLEDASLRGAESVGPR